MKYDRAFFDRGLDRRGTQSEKWDDRDVLNADCIPLWVADMDFPCADEIRQALLERAVHPSYGYNAEDTKDTDAFCGYWQRRHGLTILAEQTQMLPCVVTGLRICVRAFTTPGDQVGIFSPCYGPFAESVRGNGRELKAIPLLHGEDGRFQMNLAALEEALKGGVKLFMLCNPQNPVSRAWRREELEALLRLLKKYRVPLVSDEIHADFVFAPNAFVPMLSIPEARDCTVMLCAVSKTFNVAGLQQSEAVCMNAEMLSRFRDVYHASGATAGNTFALAGTRAAYTACDAWLDGLISYLDENRRALPNLIEKYLPKARLTPIEATYLAWIDLTDYGMNCEQLDKAFKDHGVALVRGTFFGPEGEGHMRLNFGCPRAQLEEGIRRMGEAVKEEKKA